MNVRISPMVAIASALLAATGACGDDRRDDGIPLVDGGTEGSVAHADGSPADGDAGDGGGADAGDAGDASGGIARNHPGDQGIDQDPDVIFADDFENYADASKLWDRWDNVYQGDRTRIATESGDVFAGKRSLEFTIPQGNEELSNAIQKVLTTELDVMYLRWYSKFGPNNDIVGSSHNGGGMSAHYYEGGQATPGVPANGTNKFLVEFEHWRGDATTKAPGQMNVYVYHPEQRDDYGDHFFPSGLVMPNTSLPFDFGPDFVAQPEVTPELDRWYCYELMVKANTPGQRDGRITLWLDGEQIANFGNIRFRDIDTLKLDRFNLSFHARQSPNETKKYYDNVVAAKSYIGPMTQP